MKLTDLLLDVQATTEQAKSGLDEVARDLQQFAGREADAKMNIKGLSEVISSLKAADEELRRFGDEEATAKVRVQVVGPSRSQLQDIINQAESTLGSGLARSPGGSSSYGNESGLRAFLRDVQSLESMGRDAELVAKDLGTEIEDVGTKASQAGGSSGSGFSGFETSLARLQPMLAGIGVLLAISLAPALLALAASAAQAVVALGALAAAAAGLMLPAGIAMIAVMTRIADVTAAVTAGLKANDATMAGNQSAIKQSTAAQDAQAQSLQALKQARDQLQESEAAYTQAVIDARQKIADALRTEKQDTTALADAQTNLQDTTTKAYQAWQDAIEKVKQDLFALQDAQIGVEQSHLNVDTAVNKLKSDMAAASSVSTEYLSLFKRITDVNLSNLNVGQLTREISAVPTGASDQQTADQLKQDLLDLVKARLAEKEATDKVHTSEVQLARDRQTELQFAQQGINAYAPYRGAVQAVVNAQDTLNKATDAYNKLQQQGVYGQQSVISAERAVENAHYALARAQREAGKAALEVANNVGTEQNAFQQAMAILTPAEQELTRTIIGLVKWFEGMTGPFTDAIAGIANGFILQMEGQAKRHMDVIQGFFKTLVRSINSIATDLESSKWEAFWTQMFQGADAIVPVLARAFLDLANIFREIASAALPYLIATVGEVVGWIDKLSESLGRGHTAADLMSQIMHSLGVWLQLVYDVARMVIDVMLALGPIGDGMVAWVDKAIRGINAFLESPKGKHDLQDFVKEFVPLIEAVTANVAKFAVSFLYLLELAAPALVPSLNILGVILDILTAILSVLNLLPGPAIAVLGYLAGITATVVAARRAWAFLGQFAVEALTVIRTFIADTLIPIIEGIGEAIVAVAAVIGVPVEVVVAIIAAIVAVAILVITHWTQVKNALLGIWHDIERGAESWASTLAGAWGWLENAARNVVGAVVAALRGLGNWIAGAAHWVGGVADSFGNAIVGGLRSAWGWIKGVGNDIVGVFDWIAQRILDVVHGLGGPFSAAWNWIVAALRDAINFMVGIINFFIRTWDATPFGSGIHFSAGPLGNVDVPGFHIGEIPKLAAGGIATRAMYALFGENGPEAVIPLKADVLAELGKSVVRAMGAHPAAATGKPSQLVQHNEFNIQAPAGTNPDPAFALSRIATGMRQRGLGLVGMAT